MATNTLKARIVMKHEVESDWAQAKNFKPLLGEIIVYEADNNYTIPRIKIGDGNTIVNELPFLNTNFWEEF